MLSLLETDMAHNLFKVKLYNKLYVSLVIKCRVGIVEPFPFISSILATVQVVLSSVAYDP